MKDQSFINGCSTTSNVPHFSQANHFEAKLSSLIGQSLWNSRSSNQYYICTTIMVYKIGHDMMSLKFDRMDMHGYSIALQRSCIVYSMRTHDTKHPQ